MSAAWSRYFRAPVYRNARVADLSPDRGVVLSNKDGKFDAYAWDRTDGTLTKVTTTDAAIVDATISRDGRHIYYLGEREPGSEKGHILSVDFGGGHLADLTPNLPDYYGFSVAATDLGVAITGVDDTGPFVCLADEDSCVVHRISSNMGEVVVSAGGDQLLLTDFMPDEGVRTRVRRIDPTNGSILGELPFATATIATAAFAVVSIEDEDWTKPALWHVDGTVERLEIELSGDLIAVDISRDGSVLLVKQSHRSIETYHLFNMTTRSLTRLATPNFSLDDRSSGSLIDNDSAIVSAAAEGQPPRPIVATTTGWAEALDEPSITTFDVPRWQEVTIARTSETDLHGWLMTPDGAGPWKTVLYTHGGPTSVQCPTYSPIALAFVSSGYAFLSINYSGSTMYGKAHREALTGNIGGPDIDDVITAAHWLVESGVATSEALVKCGYSYGGYLTLQALGKHPLVFAAGLAGAAISDWSRLHELSPMTRGYCVQLFGGTPQEVPERYKAASPISYADGYRTPLIISQPENDARTPYEPIAIFSDALASHGSDVRLERLRAGHTGSGTDQMISMMTSWIDFANDIIDG